LADRPSARRAIIGAIYPACQFSRVFFFWRVLAHATPQILQILPMIAPQWVNPWSGQLPGKCTRRETRR